MVTFDGKAIEHGAIRFEPLDGMGPSAGTTIQNGKYQLLIAPGKKRVTIDAFRYEDSKVVNSYPGFKDGKTPVQILPPKYNTESELEAEISPSQTTPHNFILNSD